MQSKYITAYNFVEYIGGYLCAQSQSKNNNPEHISKILQSEPCELPGRVTKQCTVQ